MNAPVPFKPTPRTTFTAWSLLEGSRLAQPVTLFHATLPEIEREIGGCGHGATVFVTEHDGVTGVRILHAYRIRKGKWVGGFDRSTHSKIYPHYADRLFAVPVDAFAPTAPWTVTRDGDVVGIVRELIEGRVL